MQQKGIVFTTRLSVSDCANLFRETGDALRGVGRKLLEATAKVAGHGDLTGYYTPEFNSPFARVDGIPEFAVGINIMKFSAAAQGNGTHVHMYVDDRGDHRDVQLVSNHTITGGMRSGRMVRKFFEAFQGTDAGVRVTDSKV
ncbi:hypothetical protein [Catenulispora rubra]|uniref:hypothetical protein n=1 Tax=Catenulispora rubra TaxID=280293 RepID=UPI00189237C4|nr:hypothetical protein [Catenulispora rubra]